jgi:hypothetical protein
MTDANKNAASWPHFPNPRISRCVTIAVIGTQSVTQHPRSAPPDFALDRLLFDLPMIMPAARMVAMRLRLTWLMGTALIAFPGRPVTRIHNRKAWRRDYPGRLLLTMRAQCRLLIFHNLPQLAERTAPDTNIFIYRHNTSPQFIHGSGAAIRRPGKPNRLAGTASSHLSLFYNVIHFVTARSTSPARYLIGPLALSLMSKSKISVGSHSVAQALGISTIPLIWPSTGAVPRIA